MDKIEDILQGYINEAKAGRGMAVTRKDLEVAVKQIRMTRPPRPEPLSPEEREKRRVCATPLEQIQAKRLCELETEVARLKAECTGWDEVGCENPDVMLEHLKTLTPEEIQEINDVFNKRGMPRGFRAGAEAALRWAYRNYTGLEPDIDEFTQYGLRAVCGGETNG